MEEINIKGLGRKNNMNYFVVTESLMNEYTGRYNEICKTVSESVDKLENSEGLNASLLEYLSENEDIEELTKTPYNFINDHLSGFIKNAMTGKESISEAVKTTAIMNIISNKKYSVSDVYNVQDTTLTENVDSEISAKIKPEKLQEFTNNLKNITDILIEAVDPVNKLNKDILKKYIPVFKAINEWF